MNLDINSRPLKGGLYRLIPAWLALVFSLALLGAGCGDRGPTNLYSRTFFGVNKGDPHFVVWRVNESNFSSVSGTADNFDVYLKNTGSGAAIGPLKATLSSSQVSCAMPLTYGSQANAVAIFGQQGQVIEPGDTVRGYAIDDLGFARSDYAYAVNFSCAGTDVNFTIVSTDPSGKSWTDVFSARSF